MTLPEQKFDANLDWGWLSAFVDHSLTPRAEADELIEEKREKGPPEKGAGDAGHDDDLDDFYWDEPGWGEDGDWDDDDDELNEGDELEYDHYQWAAWPKRWPSVPWCRRPRYRLA